MGVNTDTTTIIHALAWRCRTGIVRFPLHHGHSAALPPTWGARQSRRPCLSLPSSLPAALARANRRGYGNLGMVFCGCHIAHSFRFSELVIAFLVYWSLFCWVPVPSGCCLFGYEWGVGFQFWFLAIGGMHGRRPPLSNMHHPAEQGNLGNGALWVPYSA